jgi:hypothetical protein
MAVPRCLANEFSKLYGADMRNGAQSSSKSHVGTGNRCKWRREWESNPRFPVVVLESLGDQPKCQTRSQAVHVFPDINATSKDDRRLWPSLGRVPINSVAPWD